MNHNSKSLATKRIRASFPPPRDSELNSNVKNKKKKTLREIEQTGTFNKLARLAARISGHPAAFGIAVTSILIWAAMGPAFKFSDTWQLVINTATTIITFLMVFLLQNTQNRDSQAMQLKLDELLRATQTAHNALLNIEELSEEELGKLKQQFETLAKKARADLRLGKTDLGCPESKQGNGKHPHASPN